MIPYSFYCTPCGKAHAGECPPKPKVPVLSLHLGSVRRIFIPHTGTQWNVEDYNFVTNDWKHRSDFNLHFTVKSVDHSRMVAVCVTQSDGIGPWDQEIDLDAFLDTGHTGSSGSRFRMVLRP